MCTYFKMWWCGWKGGKRSCSLRYISVGKMHVCVCVSVHVCMHGRSQVTLLNSLSPTSALESTRGSGCVCVCVCVCVWKQVMIKICRSRTYFPQASVCDWLFPRSFPFLLLSILLSFLISLLTVWVTVIVSLPICFREMVHIIDTLRCTYTGWKQLENVLSARANINKHFCKLCIFQNISCVQFGILSLVKCD